MASENETA
jgi:N-acetylmuramic acid 6-phosphate etherase